MWVGPILTLGDILYAIKARDLAPCRACDFYPASKRWGLGICGQCRALFWAFDVQLPPRIE